MDLTLLDMLELEVDYRQMLVEVKEILRIDPNDETMKRERKEIQEAMNSLNRRIVKEMKRQLRKRDA